uniref:Uncharacterized protein n=1 Tax=Panagrolaimus davidi TaxID=227884 RepID=A0A914P4W3_9BILA
MKVDCAQQSVTGSDPNQLNNNNVQQDVIKKDVTTEEQEIKKPTKKSEEKNATIEKDATVESPAPGSNGPLARRKKYKLSGPKPKDDNTEFERIKTKARPARQKKNSLVSGTKNLARMMETAKTKEELSLKSFDEDDELVTARLEPTQPISEKAADNNKTSDNKTSDNKTSDNKTSDNKTSDDTATPEKSTKAKTLEKSAEVTTTTTAEKSVKVTTKTTTTTPARSAELTTDKDKGDNFKHSDYL